MARVLVALALVVLLAVLLKPDPRPPADPGVCAGPRLEGLQAVNDAMEQGYEIDRRHGCITKASFDAVATQQAQWQAARDARLVRERSELAGRGQSSLAQARHGFVTAVSVVDSVAPPLPSPPPSLFVRSDYRNADNYMLPGYVSPDPGDGARHPAIVWVTGGDSSTLSDFWEPGPDSNDQSMRAFRDAGIVMALPTLRGGHGHRSGKQFLLGEVDDVIAAAEQLAQLRYVDPDRIYLGGHSTGGTLVLLVAAMPSRFRAVFAFGPVARADRYPAPLLPIDFTALDAMELKLRSPIEWLDGIERPTYLIEGADGAGNHDDLAELCRASRNRHLRCLSVPRADHFSVLRPASRRIAAQIVGNADGTPVLRAEDLAP